MDNNVKPLVKGRSYKKPNFSRIPKNEICHKTKGLGFPIGRSCKPLVREHTKLKQKKKNCASPC